jgi:hypothetical protein
MMQHVQQTIQGEFEQEQELFDNNRSYWNENMPLCVSIVAIYCI